MPQLVRLLALLAIVLIVGVMVGSCIKSVIDQNSPEAVIKKNAKAIGGETGTKLPDEIDERVKAEFPAEKNQRPESPNPIR